MDIIDKIFNKLPKEQAPHSLRASILQIPEQQVRRHFSWTKILAPAMVVLLLVMGGVYYRYFSVPKLAAAFEITVDGQDAAGIAPNSVFVLKSSKDITASQVKRVVKMYSATDGSAVDFDVDGDGKNRFRIKPKTNLDGNTIYKVSIAEGVAERDFAWAFQVRAPFGAVSTFPRNQATGVPTNTSIEITFNREHVINPEKYLSISPNVQGKVEIHNDTVVFVPSKPLAEKTIYTVTVAKGLTAENSSENLTTDIVFAFETSQTSYQPYGSLSIPEGLVQFPTDRQPALQVYAYNVDLKNAEANVYAYGNKEDFVKAYYNSRNWDLGWSYYYRQEGSGLASTEKLTRVSSFKPEIISFEYQSWLELPNKLPAGYYIFDLVAGDIHRQAWIIVNDISHYYTLTDNNGLVWAYQFSQKQPLPDARVAYYDAAGVRHELGKTNSDGLAQFAVPEGLQSGQINSADYAKPKLLEIEQPGKPASLALVAAGWWYASANNVQDNYWKYVATERYTYKLTDSVKFWGVLKGKAEDLKNQQVTVQLREGYYYYDFSGFPGYINEDRPLAETQATISQFDTFSGKLDFKGAKPGTYNLTVLHNGKFITQASLEILNYTKPLYHISVTPDKPAVFTGEPVSFNVKAEFYDGTPVGQLSLRYSGYYNQEISGTLTLNAKGEGKVTITPEYFDSSYYPYTLSLSFYPELAEEGEINSESVGSTLVFGPRVYLQASQKYNDKDNFSITAKTNFITIGQTPGNRDAAGYGPEYIGKPAPGVALSAEIERTEYQQIDAGTAYDPINKISVPQYRYEEKKTIVQTLNATTNANGEWVFDAQLPKVERGFYQIRIFGTDGGGRKISATLWPYYYRNYEGYYSGSTANGNRVVLSLGFSGGAGREYNQQFSIGEQVPVKAELLDGKDLVSGKTLFYRYGHKGIGGVQMGNSDTWQDTFKDDFKPAVTYRAVVFGPYGFVESNSLYAGYKQDDAKLQIEISPDKQTYRPGDTANLRVAVKDKDGKTHDGEVNLSVVDEAVFDVVPYYWQQDILQSLYTIDYSDPRSDASDFTPPAFQEGGGAEGGGCFLPETLITLPGGRTERIDEIKVGDIVLTKAGEQDNAQLVPAIVQGISRHEVGSYLVINNSLKVTEEHKLYVNGAWLAAGYIKVGDSLVGTDGKKVAVSSVEKVIAPKTMVYNINVGKYHTYFAGGLYVHNAEKGGGYRSEFLDTAHFESKELKNGQAEFSVKLPDNITSWRATASAFGPDKIMAGQEHKQLPASLPFFVDAVISETYLAGDKPTVTVRTFGTEANNNAPTQYWVDIDGLNYHETQTLKSGSVDYVLPALPLGSYELKIRAKQASMEDGIVRRFNVVQSYFVNKTSKLTELANGQKGLPANSGSYTDVTFTDMGKAQFYNELLWNSYQGGKRADQVTSAYLARKMLKENFGSTEDVPAIDLGSYHVPEGGIGLFTYGDSDLVLSAQLADVVPDAVYQAQLLAYFRNQMRDSKADIHRTAVSLYGLASLNQPVLSKLQLISDEKDLTLEDKMYIALGLAKLGDKEGARKLYEQAIAPELRTEADRAWLSKEQDESKRNKLTTLAGAVAASAGVHDQAMRIWAYAKEHYPTKQLDILERMIIIREEIGRLNTESAEFTYEVNGKTNKVTLERGRSTTLRFYADELHSITFSGIQGKPVAIAVLNEYKDPNALAKNTDLSVKRTYWVNGRQVTTFEEGSTVLVRLEFTMNANAIDGGYQVVDYLPSGLKPISYLWQRGLTYNWARCTQRGFPLAVEGNVVYFSAYHNANSSSLCPVNTIEYYARAASKGEFNANPSLIQSLVNYDSLNVSESQDIRIVPPSNSGKPIVLPQK